MTPQRTRAILAFLVVGVFMGITALLAVFPLVSSASVPLSDYADFFNKTAGVYTGIVGVIIGYYFGRTGKAETARDPTAKSGTLREPGPAQGKLD